MLTYVIPTRDRSGELMETLVRIGRLGQRAHAALGGARVVVLDNDSREAVRAPARVGGVPVSVERMGENMGAAARNVGVELAGDGCEWVVMLDDDSAPLDARFVSELAGAPADVAAVGADIFLPKGGRESGGLPEVFVGCGVALRRSSFLAVGGYDARFGYYAEEYDLAAKLIARGERVAHSAVFRVEHRKVPGGRDFGVILKRLVVNNGRVVHRYAPDGVRGWMLGYTLERYGAIARKEGVESAYVEAARELEGVLEHEERTALGAEAWDRFVGVTAAVEGLGRARGLGVESVRLVRRGKHDWALEEACARVGIAVDGGSRDALVGTLSPGPMLDGEAAESASGAWRRVVCGWRPARTVAGVAVAA